jgi:RNA polymerase sigma-70 factor, ECF subfamily
MIDDKPEEKPELDKMSNLLYAELKKIAANQLRLEKPGHTLQPTALVHEVYLRLAECEKDMGDRSRSHFLATAATLMRQILVNHARGRNAQKRGGGAFKVTLGDNAAIATNMTDNAVEVLAVDSALSALANFDERKAHVIELKYFGGLTEDEIAEVLEISKSTVSREVRLGLALLHRQMSGQNDSSGT